MKKIASLLGAVLLVCNLLAQNVGIGTSTPQARLHVTDSSVVFSAAGGGPSQTGNPPIQGAGRRMMWYADKAAFRVGYVTATQWDKNNIGIYSFAAGYETTALGHSSTAMGYMTTASGFSSTAMGDGTIATGTASTAFGSSTTASGNGSTAMGFESTASNIVSTAMGWGSIASGLASTSMGRVTTAAGDYSTAMGYGTTAMGSFSTASGFNTTASGSYSTAMGSYVSTNGYNGSLIIGDNSTTTVLNIAVSNSFRARFDGGYRFFTSAAAINAESCQLPAGGNAWVTASDFRLKEKVTIANGEDFLKKISLMKLGSWNYISQNPLKQRHYGPMAQDFYTAFGKDEFGTIGNDTTINSADFDGVNLIAIQALEKRTQKIEQLEKENEELRKMMLQLRKEMDELKK